MPSKNDSRRLGNPPVISVSHPPVAEPIPDSPIAALGTGAAFDFGAASPHPSDRGSTSAGSGRRNLVVTFMPISSVLPAAPMAGRGAAAISCWDVVLVRPKLVEDRPGLEAFVDRDSSPPTSPVA